MSVIERMWSITPAPHYTKGEGEPTTMNEISSDAELHKALKVYVWQSALRQSSHKAPKWPGELRFESLAFVVVNGHVIWPTLGVAEAYRIASREFSNYNIQVCSDIESLSLNWLTPGRSGPPDIVVVVQSAWQTRAGHDPVNASCFE